MKNIIKIEDANHFFLLNSISLEVQMALLGAQCTFIPVDEGTILRPGNVVLHIDTVSMSLRYANGTVGYHTV